MVSRVSKGGPEPFWSIILQVFPTFIVAGLGMVAAGLVLSNVQKWRVFVEVNEILIMVPALLGLKGNLEMTLAARLSTAANIGQLDRRKDAVSLIFGNIILVQCQWLDSSPRSLEWLWAGPQLESLITTTVCYCAPVPW